MKTNEFQALSAALESLAPHQKRQLADQLHKIEHVHAVSLLIESRLLSVSACPHAATLNLRAGTLPQGYSVTGVQTAMQRLMRLLEPLSRVYATKRNGWNIHRN